MIAVLDKTTDTAPRGPYFSSGTVILRNVGIVALLSLGTLFLVLSSPLNPWSRQYPDIDSSIFIYFGMAMRKGYVPYRDMFDHKGPFLWVIEWLGVTLGNGSMAGIWFLEWAFLLFDAWFLYKAARLFTKSDWIAVLAAGLSLEPLIHFFEDGNYGEEWALPFIIYSFYVFLRFFKVGAYRLWEVCLTGVCMGCVLGIRVNMIAVWAVFVFLIFCNLIWRKRWKELRNCCIAFLGGVLAATLPFIIYYAAKGVLGDMWYAHITYNLLYCKDSGGWAEGSKFMKVTLRANWIVAVPVILYLAYLPVRDIRAGKPGWEWCIPVFYGVTLMMAAVGGRNFPHYAIVLLPCLTIPLCVLTEEARRRLPGRGITVTAFLAVLCLFTLRGDLYKQKEFIEANATADENDEELISFIQEHSEEEEPILVMSLNAKYYITANRFADTKYFIQHFMYDDDRSLFKKMTDYIDSTPPKLVILRVYNVDGDPWGEWMTDFNEEMMKKAGQGIYRHYANGFFVAYERVNA